jgi:hypothetical protein
MEIAPDAVSNVSRGSHPGSCLFAERDHTSIQDKQVDAFQVLCTLFIIVGMLGSTFIFV